LCMSRGAAAGRADGGTLFLDEIGEMHPSAQAKLLRAVEEQAVYRLGGQQRIPLNLRIIAATNQDLERLVVAGQFRPDLYFRLNVARIHLPPLRERTLDLWPLCAHYIQVLNRRGEQEVEGFTADVFAALLRYAWPGNVRELKHLLEAIFITVSSRVITFMDLPEPFRRRLGNVEGLPVSEQEQLLTALVATQWNKSQAAKQLHWSRMTLYRKLRQYQLTAPRERPPPRPSTYGRGQEQGNVPGGVRAPRGTAMGTGGPPSLPSWELPEALWQRMAAVIPPRKSQAGHPRTVDLRRITEGIFYVLRVVFQTWRWRLL
jgi:DNA-binding NtrC family response regulator